MSVRSYCCCLLAAALCHSSVMAQPPGAPAVPPAGRGALALAVDQAWERALLSAQTAGELARADAGRRAAEAWWAAPPALELAHRDDRFDRRTGRRESDVGIAWPLLLPQQRSARIGAAGADVAYADALVRAGRWRVAGEVREAAWTVAASDAELAVAGARVEELRALARDVDRRVTAGDLARADLLAARGELAAAEAVESAARQRRHAALAQWRYVTGSESPAAAAESVAGAPAAPHPELALVQHDVERARQRLALVRVTRSDAPDLVVRYRQDTPGSGASDQNSVGIAVRIPFGTPDRNRPRDAAALNELALAEATERRLRERLAADADTARAAVAAAERQLAAEQTRHALLRERARLIETSFKLGETALPEFLRALAAASQAEAGLQRQQAELGLARARLNQSLGVLP